MTDPMNDAKARDMTMDELTARMIAASDAYPPIARQLARELVAALDREQRTYQRERDMTKTIRKRDGSAVAFDLTKIEADVLAALRETGERWPAYSTHEDAASFITRKVHSALFSAGKLFGPTFVPTVDGVQDQVERELMINGFVATAKAYILRRAARSTDRSTRWSIDPRTIELAKRWLDADDPMTDCDLDESAQDVSRALLAAPALYEEVVRLRKALVTYMSLSMLARGYWDDDKDLCVGKLLIAMSGLAPGYRADLDEIHALLKQPLSLFALDRERLAADEALERAAKMCEEKYSDPAWNDLIRSTACACAVLIRALIGAQPREHVEADEARVQCAGMPAERDVMRAASIAIGGWLSAALEDPGVCAEMKRDINAWFDAGMPSSLIAAQNAAIPVTGEDIDGQRYRALWNLGFQVERSTGHTRHYHHKTDADAAIDEEIRDWAEITGAQNAAPQTSIAMATAAPSSEGVGQGESVDAAPATKKGGDANEPAIPGKNTVTGNVRAALNHLVALKDLKMWIESGTAPDWAKKKYEAEKEPAWLAARLALEQPAAKFDERGQAAEPAQETPNVAVPEWMIQHDMARSVTTQFRARLHAAEQRASEAESRAAELQARLDAMLAARPGGGSE